jgi:hypothetical protein
MEIKRMLLLDPVLSLVHDVTGFQASNGWLWNFKKRFNLTIR